MVSQVYKTIGLLRCPFTFPLHQIKTIHLAYCSQLRRPALIKKYPETGASPMESHKFNLGTSYPHPDYK